jgi:hypothetical protein
MSIVTIITEPEIGGVFLTWSIHYLSGDTEYYLSKHSVHSQVINCGIQKLPKNPLTKKNAHNFYPNQFHSIDDQLNLYLELKKTSKLKNHIVYFHNMVKNIGNEESIKQAVENSDKTILLELHDKDLFYNCKFDFRADYRFRFDDPKIKIYDYKEFWEHWLAHYFDSSYQKYKESNVNNVWSLREFIAINLKHHVYAPKITNYFDLNYNHYKILSSELWNVINIEALFDYLEIKIDATRIKNWYEIYNIWKQMHQERILFLTYIDTIIDYILNDYYLDLTRFNLDIIQEATIQHILIYKHDLNLKSWQLNKFTDTRQLHSLLEPNIHRTLGT